jgi:hypothetical protein
MEHYVTLFDSLFLPQGLALHLSMERHIGQYKLWIVCMDDALYEALRHLNLPNVSLLQISRLEVNELKSVKLTRTTGEYCWTVTPFAPRFVFEADAGVARVTYIDADLWFRKHPGPIFAEFDFSEKHVLITDHAYAPEYDASATSGQYCVQFMTFTREGGESIRKWWEDRCVEWCFARYEDGKFGDQKYLDDWPVRFPNKIHVLSDKELILAPWNSNRFPYGRAICWHFHSLRIVSSLFKNRYGVDCGNYPLPPVTIENVYREYLRDLHLAIGMIEQAGGQIRSQKQRTLALRLRSFWLGRRNQRWRTAIGLYLPL